MVCPIDKNDNADWSMNEWANFISSVMGMGAIPADTRFAHWLESGHEPDLQVTNSWSFQESKEVSLK